MSGLRFAVVGCGLMGGWHARYARRAGGRLVALVDPDGEAARKLAGGSEAVYAELSSCLDAERPEMVHICTPPSNHAPLIELALAGGAHVLCEKPLASDTATTEHLLEAAARAGRQLVPVHQFPFQRGMRKLLARLPHLGTLRQVELRIFSAGAQGRKGEERREVLLEILPHAAALFRALGFRNVPTSHFQVERCDDDGLVLAAQVGPTRLSSVIDLRVRPTRNELEITGSAGSALVDLFHGHAYLDRAGVGRLTKALRPIRLAALQLQATSVNLCVRAVRGELAYPGLRELIEAFYRAADRNGVPPIPAEEAIQAAALIDHVRSAAARFN